MHTFIYKYIATYTLYIFIRGIDYMALEHTLDWGVSLRAASAPATCSCCCRSVAYGVQSCCVRLYRIRLDELLARVRLEEKLAC